MKYYAVTNGRVPGVYDDWFIVERQIRGYMNAEYKIFDDYNEAYQYVKDNAFNKGKKNQIRRLEREKSKNQKLQIKGFCKKCGKPIQKTYGLCKTCGDKSKKELKKIKDIKYTDSIHFDKEKNVPPYIKTLLGETKECIYINGNKRNPLIYFKCLKCDSDFRLRYNDLKRHTGHNCEAALSNGEFIVGNFLKEQNIDFKVQRDTLRCVNPKTKAVLPYDFELSDKKIIIEVQGEQHRTFISRFHITEDGFEYQKEKDKYKKEFAIKNGYTFIEIWYDDFKNDKYKKIILDAVG